MRFPKGVIFDMDGLMFDTERLAIEAWEYALKELGLTVSKELLMQSVGLNGEKTNALFAGHIEGFDFIPARRLWNEYFDAYIAKHGVPVKKGLKELLDYLKEKDVSLAVGTSTKKEKTHGHLRDTGLSGCFDAVVTGDMAARSKPAPDIFLLAAERMGLDPAECMVLEDSPYGIAAAYEAGMMPVVVVDLLQPGGETLQRAAWVCEDLFEVKERLNPLTK